MSWHFKLTMSQNVPLTIFRLALLTRLPRKRKIPRMRSLMLGPPLYDNMHRLWCRTNWGLLTNASAARLHVFVISTPWARLERQVSKTMMPSKFINPIKTQTSRTIGHPGLATSWTQSLIERLTRQIQRVCSKVVIYLLLVRFMQSQWLW